jgi:beta-lactamase class A
MSHQRVLVLLSIFYILSSCSQPMTTATVKKQITDRFSKETGVFAVAFKDLSTGEEILINEREKFHAASTMKTPVMIEVYKQAAEGKFSLNDSMVIRNEFKSIVDSSLFSLSPEDDSDKELYKHVGEPRTISALVYDMIIVSSNLATNMVIELVNAKNVTQTMRGLGADSIQVLRGVEDSKAYEKGLSNTTTAYDLMVIFEKMAAGHTVNPEASKAMTDILLDQRFNDIIPARLPKEVKVAHKTGDITGVRHDCGIIILPDGRKYVLVLLSKKLEKPDAGIAAMAEVSELLYNFVTNRKK